MMGEIRRDCREARNKNKKSTIVLICPLKVVKGKADAIGNKIRHSLKYRSYCIVLPKRHT